MQSRSAKHSSPAPKLHASEGAAWDRAIPGREIAAYELLRAKPVCLQITVNSTPQAAGIGADRPDGDDDGADDERKHDGVFDGSCSFFVLNKF